MSTSDTTYKNGDIIAIRSNNFNTNYVRLDGTGCNSDNRNCGTVNTIKSKSVSEKFVLMQKDTNVFCMYNMKYPLVFLKLDATACTAYNANGCGTVKGYYGDTDTSCPDGTTFKIVQIGTLFVFQSQTNLNANLRLDAGSSTTTVAGGTVNAQYTNTGSDPTGAYLFYTIEVEGNILTSLNSLASKYSPYFYINSGEKHYPVAIESMAVNWTGDLTSNTTKIEYNYAAGGSFSNSAPLYVSFTRESSGFDVNYAILFAYNDCGPTATITAKVVSNVGTVGVDDSRIYLCPGGIHNGDLEHVRINYNSDGLGLNKIYFGYHDSEHELGTSDVKWDGNHPVAYMAKGSHALYATTGEQEYLKLWYEKSGTDSQCAATCTKTVSVPYPCGVKTCKKLGISYPCGVKTCSKDADVDYPCTKSCWIGAITEGWFIDFPPDSGTGTKWTPPLRLILSGVAAFDDSGLSNDEKKFVSFQGRLGPDIENDGWEAFETAVLGLTSTVRSACSSCNTAIKSGLDSAAAEYESEAPTSVATKGWFKQ